MKRLLETLRRAGLAAAVGVPLLLTACGGGGGGGGGGGAGADTTAPAIVSIAPLPGATNVALDGAVSVSFSEEVDCATVTTTSFTLAAGLTPVSGSVACSGTSATFTPSAALAPSTTHLATVSALVKDRAGNALSQARIWSFVTEAAALDTTPPAVVSVTPPVDAMDVALESIVTVSFTEAVDCATVNGASFMLATGGDRVSGVITCSGSTATFTPAASLAPGATHTATVTTAVADVAGNALAAARIWSFTTGSAPDTTPPEIRSVAPAAGATAVPVDAIVTASFSEALDCATVTASSFTLATGGGRVDGTIACSGSTVTFTPSAPLAGEVRHTATVAAADRAGNASGSIGWSFTTGRAPDTTPPAVASLAPAAGARGVATNAAVSVTFSEPVDCGSVTAATFTLETLSHAPVAGAVTCAGAAATFRPSAPLARSTEYVATVTTGVKDTAGNALRTAQAWHFTTTTGAWSAATRVDGGDDEVDAFKVAVNASGAAVAVWVQTDAANQSHLRWAGYDPAVGWSAPEAAESLAGNASQPQVAIDARGDSVVAWTQTDSGGPAVWTRVRAADGTWGGPLKLWGTSPALGVDGSGNVTCVWRHDDGTRTNVWATRYPLGTATLSGTWEAATLIEAEDGRSAVSGPSLAVSKAGDAVAVWTFYVKAFDQFLVVANRYSIASGRWGSPVDLSLSASKWQLNPAVVMNDAGEAVAIWRQEYLNGWSYVTVISTARYTSTGWSPATQFDWIDGLLAAPPSVAGNGRGDVEVVWAPSTCDQVGYRRLDAGAGWATQGLLPASSCADRPAVALDPDGNAVVAWGERTSGSETVLEVARYSTATGAWDAAALTVGASLAILPAIASDASGGHMAMWLRWTGTRHELLASRYE